MNEEQTNEFSSLFDKAKSERPKVSFEDAKQQFLSSVNVQEKPNESKADTGGFSLKTWIMITTIIGLGVIAIMNFSPLNPGQENTIENNQVRLEVSDSIIIQEEQLEVFEEYKLAEKNKISDNTLIDEEFQAESNDSIVLSEIVIKEKVNTLKSKKTERKTVIYEEEYRFPKLNDSEIKANHKEKKRMLKALEKMSDKYYSYIPSNTHKIGDKKISSQAFYIGQTEVTNLEYRTFLFDLLIHDRKAEFLKARPDQAMWTKEYPESYNEPMEKQYFSHEAYNEYPVVGISREAAEMYCAWLTTETNKVYGAKTGEFINDVRIPTNSEWIIAARGGKGIYKYPWGGPLTTNMKGCYLANYNPESNDMKADGAFHPAKVRSYIPNGHDLYCMSGNVAEMVYYSNGPRENPGTKGGSWTSSEEELQIEGSDRFKGQTKPSVNIGFRVVITHLNKSNKGVK